MCCVTCHRYFARIAEERMGPEDQVILVTHQPRWLMDWFWEEAATHNLRQLVRGHLRGRARVHLAGPQIVTESHNLASASWKFQCSFLGLQDTSHLALSLPLICCN